MYEVKNITEKFDDNIAKGIQNIIEDESDNYARALSIHYSAVGQEVPLAVVETLLDNLEAQAEQIKELESKISDMSWVQPTGNRIVPDGAWPGDGDNPVVGDME